jgi:hypothetical protein
VNHSHKSSRFVAALIVLAGIAAGPASAGVVDVTPANPNGWAFSNLDNSPNTNASGDFELGPSIPPLGTGSAQFIVNDSKSSEILYQVFGTRTSVDNFTTLSYSTYVTASTSGSGAAPTLQFDLYNGSGSYQGRLVFDPGLLGTVGDEAWQTWNGTTADAWYFSHAGLGTCTINGSYCTLSQAEGVLDQDGIVAGDVLFKAGSGQANFNGNVDDFALNSTDYNFDPVRVPEPFTLSIFGAGLAGAAVMRRRKKAKPV